MQAPLSSCRIKLGTDMDFTADGSMPAYGSDTKISERILELHYTAVPHVRVLWEGKALARILEDLRLEHALH
jgi:hypothetical protein